MRLIAGIAALLSVLCFATGAFAHATLVSTDPADGSVVAQAPKMVHLRFNEAVTPAVVSLIDADGKTRDDVTVRVAGVRHRHAAGQSAARHPGRQLPRHLGRRPPRRGLDVFSVGAVTGAVAAESRAGSVNGLIWLARIGVYLGLFVGVGGAFFVGWIGLMRRGCAPDRLRLGSGPGQCGGGAWASRPRFAGSAPGGLADGGTVEGRRGNEPVSVPADRRGGDDRRLRGAAKRAARVRGALSAFAMAGVGLSLASSGHAATATPQWLSAAAVFLHGVGVAFWVGALAPLAAMAWRPGPPLLPVLNRFSSRIFVVACWR